MNHDYAHCSVYKKSKCPKSCFYAQLEEDLRKLAIELHYLPISYADMSVVIDCGRKK